jgi:hypothetical protein
MAEHPTQLQDHEAMVDDMKDFLSTFQMKNKELMNPKP